MNLTEVYRLAKEHTSYNDFRSAIDEIINNTPQSAITSNEFVLVGIDNTINKDSLKEIMNTIDINQLGSDFYRKKTVIVDIDGTIAKVGDRLKYLKTTPPDWDKFYDSCFEDEPIQEIIDLVKLLEASYNIVYCTGRRESVRDITTSWLLGKSLKMETLLMRPNGDKSHDTEVKPRLLRKQGISLHEIAFVLEDRNSMVKKWRSIGVKCLQVDYGDF